MNVIYQLIEAWNLFRLTKRAKRSAQLTFRQLTEFHELIRNKSIFDNRATADDSAAEIRVARSVPGQTAFNQ